jgi:trans-aconitate methyltransferase
MATLLTHIPEDWYATAFDARSADMAWTERTGPQVDRVAKILQPRGDERILDMACGSIRHSLELRRIDVEFILSDLRDLKFDSESDLVLNLNDDAIGYLESDEENLKTFESSLAP